MSCLDEELATHQNRNGLASIEAPSSSRTSELIAHLQAALTTLQEHRVEWENEVEQYRGHLDHREELIRQAISGLREGSFSSNGNGKPVLSVSDEKLNAVREYLQTRGQARQADIAKDLDLNSGTVSVALRRLRESGQAIKGEHSHGSRMWLSSESKAKEAQLQQQEDASGV